MNPSLQIICIVLTLVGLYYSGPYLLHAYCFLCNNGPYLRPSEEFRKEYNQLVDSINGASSFGEIKACHQRIVDFVLKYREHVSAEVMNNSRGNLFKLYHKRKEKLLPKAFK